MLGLSVRRQHELPKAPVEFQDEVELYARESGRHATLRFVPSSLPQGGVVHGFWIVRFTLRTEDKRNRLYQEGKVPTPITDDTWLVDGQGKPLDLLQLGVSGLRAFLEKGSLTSGRGEYSSLEDQLAKVRAHNMQVAEKIKADAKFDSRKEQMDYRRQRLGIPLVPVGIDLGGKGEPSELDALVSPHQAVPDVRRTGRSSHAARPPERQE